MSRDVWAKKRANASGDNGWAERGGYMAAKVSKLDEQFKSDAPREKQRDGTCSTIFSGVAIYVNGYTEPSADELRRMMMLHGGQYHVYYSRSKTTHIIANNLPNCKIQELKGQKVIRPDWIIDSVKAGRLLPYLQYQLYAKHRGPLFSGMNLRQTSEIPGPSNRLPHSNLSQKPHPPQLNIHHSRLNQERPLSSCQNSNPNTPHKQLQQGNSQQSPLLDFVNPFPSPLASAHSGPEHSHFIAEPRHCSLLHTHQLSALSSMKLSPKTPEPSTITPHPGLQSQRAGQPEPQISPSCKEVESRLNGLLQTSSDFSHSRINEMQECGKTGTVQQAVLPEPLTNGHAHLVNGALKSKDSSLVADGPSGDKNSPERRPQSPLNKPMSSLRQLQTKPDPYEFPHSPPKLSNPSPCCLEKSSVQDVSEQRFKLPSSVHREIKKATEGHQLPQELQPSCHVDSELENNSFSTASQSFSHSSMRINGSHHNAFSSNPASVNRDSITVKPHTPSDKTPSSESSAQLFAQTSSLISEFYSHSRLHQISTWRTGFSEYVNELHCKRKSTGVASFPGKEQLRKSLALRPIDSQGTSAPMIKSCILHVDMDCFFVSVGIRHRPDLKGKPVAVTSNRGQAQVPLRPGANPQLEQQYYQRKHALAQPGREDDYLHSSPSQESPISHANGVDQDAVLSMAEIASCSYAARQAGVRNGMFFGKAKQLCPSLQSVPYDFEAFKEVALDMYEILAGYTHDIEALSCDEVLIDASALIAELNINPEDLARAIRVDIKEKTGCCASVGMGSNILLARLSTRKAKPDGQYYLKSEEVDDFIRDLPVTSLPGVGPVMGKKLAAIGVRSCGDLQQVSLSQLQRKFGPRTGQTLFRFCRGLDDRPVRYEKERKSVSAEMNYSIRFKGVDEAECFLSNLSMEVQKRLQEAGLRGRRVTLKVMVRKAGAPLEPAKYGGHGICDNMAKTVMLAQSTDNGQLIAAAVIKMFHAMKLQPEDLRGVGIQVQLLEKPSCRNHSLPHYTNGLRTRSIKDMLLVQGSGTRGGVDTHQEKCSSVTAPASSSIPCPLPPNEPVPGTSTDQQACRQTPKHSRKLLNFSIEIPSPSQVDRSVLEALPPDLREQVEQSWNCREARPSNRHSPSTQPSSPKSCPSSPGPPLPPPPPGSVLLSPPLGTLVLQIPNQPDGQGIVLELPNFSQVDPEVFAALPKELQEELKAAYSRVTNIQPQTKNLEQKNPLLQLKQSVSIGRVKRCYRKKTAVSPVKKGPSPLKKRQTTNSPAKTILLSVKPRDSGNILKTENGSSTSSSKPDIPESLSKFVPRPTPALAGACDLPDIKTLLREWVTTVIEPMEEDILQVVKYCTDLIEDKDLERLDLIIKYMKRLMQQSVESVWSMAFDFILDNVQVVIQQTYGSTLKVT